MQRNKKIIFANEFVIKAVWRCIMDECNSLENCRKLTKSAIQNSGVMCLLLKKQM